MKIEFDILANADDSIERAIELIAWGDNQGESRRLKQAVQSIAHGVELLLKERLRRIHPSLLWENVDKYPSLAARTVTAEGALHRLVGIGGLTFLPSDVAIIRSLRSTRNAIEHYSWTTTKQEADHIVGQALAFAVHFAKEHLSHDFLGYRARKDGTFDGLLEANRAFAASISQRVGTDDGSGEIRTEICGFCRAATVNPTTRACRICGHWEPDPRDDIPF